MMETHTQKRTIYTVSGLTRDVKTLLEDHFPFIWIKGEISNFRSPASGHHFYTLKDADAQISATMFRGQNQRLRFKPEDGLHVIGFGRISVYEPRGSYQIVMEYLEPDGLGSQQLAFEQLKSKLAAEGLFDDARKQKIPLLPRHICIITSPTGAVIQDMLHIIHRRFSNVSIDVYPVRVQGERAETDITGAIEAVDLSADPRDVCILARGGGSLEDLQAFNSEKVARAVFNSKIPVISAIGHETDYTIADFVSDLRAPTPSAAAELVVPVKADLAFTISSFDNRLIGGINHILDANRRHYKELSRWMIHPVRRLQDIRMRVEDLTGRILGNSPEKLINNYKEQHYNIKNNLLNNIVNLTSRYKACLDSPTRMLSGLNPLNVLSRGYSITRFPEGGRVITNSRSVSKKDAIEILLHRGTIEARVLDTRINNDKR